MAPKKDSLEIVLQDLNRVYLTGEQVHGSLYLDLKKKSNVKLVQIWFSGESFVNHKIGNTIYELKLPLFSLTSVLYDKDIDELNGGHFSAGEFVFPFNFPLPDDVPSSKRRQMTALPNGFTRYTLGAAVVRKGKSSINDEQVVTVLEKVDVSQPEFQIPKGNQKEKRISCCCRRGGNIYMKAKLNKSGYYPGQTIQAKVYVENMSNRDVTFIEVALGEKTFYQYGKDEYKVEAKVKARLAVEKTTTGVGMGQDADFDDLTLEIPSFLPPSTGLETPTLMTTTYFVDIIAHVKGSCITPAHIEIPIMIGSCIPMDALSRHPGLLAQRNTTEAMFGGL